MGRRSINTTKSGKYMNPTDQARKEARKRELRKNKKQRMIVRAAVLKGKDPYQIIADMERLDQMEYNVNAPPPLNEKVLKDKRRKMKETWDRLCRLYIKEDHDRYLELKRLEADYENKRIQMVKFYESVKSAQEVSIDDIPLPNAPMEQSNITSLDTSNQSIINQPQSILKKHNLSGQICTQRNPPGVPPGPPPVLSDVEDESDDENNDNNEKEKNRRIRFCDEQTEDKEADINEFLKEIEQVEKAARDPAPTQSIQSLTNLPPQPNQIEVPSHGAAIPPPPSLQPPTQTSVPPLFMFRPPMGSVPPPSGMRLIQPQPSGMVPNRPPIVPNPQLRPGMPLPRMPPPQQLPPRLPQKIQTSTMTASSLTKDGKKTGYITDRATIEAKPQLRNLSADATRFTPVALRVKREDKLVKKHTKSGVESDVKSSIPSAAQSSALKSTLKDDAYDEFMKEMQSLI